jgi:hypothetical protein
MRSARPKFRGGGRSAKGVGMDFVFNTQDDEIEVVKDVTAKEAVANNFEMTSIPSVHPDRAISRHSRSTLLPFEPHSNLDGHRTDLSFFSLLIAILEIV